MNYSVFNRLTDIYPVSLNKLAAIRSYLQTLFHTLVAVAALNFKELPAQAKKPMAALLYAAADALGGDDND